MPKVSDEAIQALIDNKTKPLGALGELEKIAFQVCRFQDTLTPTLSKPHMLVFAADHGLAESGISAYPKEVTGQMVLNFVQGGAAINSFCGQHQIALEVIDAGVDCEFEPSLPIRHFKVGRGTRNSLHAPAMTRDELEQCFDAARQLVLEKHKLGCNVIGFGEMGIGNTSSAALIEHYALNLPLHECVGRGTGLDSVGLDNKLDILQKVTAARGNLTDPTEILEQVGGYEIAMMTRAMLSAHELNMLVLVDGFIASSAALLACQINPSSRKAMIFCHQSEEPGHQHILSTLRANSVLKLNMRLGEGTGCALAYPLIESAVRFVNEMASFEDASVSNKND